MSTLSSDDFGEFVLALNGYAPFRWQQRLAEQVTTGGWPQALALPTASGKTACIDIALFALACQADWRNDTRTAPRRIFFVVDRRIIVDEALARAARIARKLETATSGILHTVAQRLRLVAGHEKASPLVCCSLRGGVYRDNAWAKFPTQPTVICTTVDQIGSRLLFRGYGLGLGTRVIHAGLAGSDAVLFLDEAHCAKPFYQSGQAIRRYREWHDAEWCKREHGLKPPFFFVVMSATPPAEIPAEAIFPSWKDWSEDLAKDDQKPLKDRVAAPKPARLIVAAREKNAKSNDRLCETLIEQATSLVDNEHKRIGIIVNRVGTAKKVHELLRARQHDTVLLTGRMRGIDRDSLFENWSPDGGHRGNEKGLLTWFGVDKNRPDLDHPVFVVATQCLEAGANLDFDGLVTECASVDALRQRFGRLNRMGREIAARAAIVIRDDQVAAAEDDPVYGGSLTATWLWLNENCKEGMVDFGVEAFDLLLPPPGDERASLLAALQMPSEDAPIMLPAHIDCWVQTAPMPTPDPDPAIFLHGPSRGVPDIQVCWRADIVPDGSWEQTWIETLSLCPPSAAECLPVPLFAMRDWLRDQATRPSALSDVETVAVPTESDSHGGEFPSALIWRGVDGSQRLDSPGQLRPGDTLVLPVVDTRAEWNVFGHVPPYGSNTSLIDRGDETNFATRGKAVLRLHPALMGDWPSVADAGEAAEAKARLLAIIQSREPEEEAAEFQGALRVLLNAGGIPERLRDLVEAMVRRRPRVYCYARISPVLERGVILVSPGRFRYDSAQETFVNDDDSSSATCEVELRHHLDRVAEYAKRFARGSGLAQELVADFELAGQLHDLGKLDERFQAWLFGGDRTRARLAPLRLAKSASQSAAARRRARAQSGYPEGARHELLSVRLLEQADSILAAAFDRDLVLYLIASHHGHCRPFAPVVFDDSPVTVSTTVLNQLVTASSSTQLEHLDSGIADRFWRLVRRYGWWRLAWLEAIFILADHRRSEDEQKESNEK
ncbi:MAG: type I-G CRISPR-associated helicase/endonuclease Cas3g [Pirellulales bacterium]